MSIFSCGKRLFFRQYKTIPLKKSFHRNSQKYLRSQNLGYKLSIFNVNDTNITKLIGVIMKKMLIDLAYLLALIVAIYFLLKGA